MTKANFSKNWSIVKVEKLCTDGKILHIAQGIFMLNIKAIALTV